MNRTGQGRPSSSPSSTAAPGAPQLLEQWRPAETVRWSTSRPYERCQVNKRAMAGASPARIQYRRRRGDVFMRHSGGMLWAAREILEHDGPPTD